MDTSPRILVFEDGDPVVRSLGWSLSESGFTVQEAYLDDPLHIPDGAQPQAVVLNIPWQSTEALAALEALINSLPEVPVIRFSKLGLDDGALANVVSLTLPLDGAQMAKLLERILTSANGDMSAK